MQRSFAKWSVKPPYPNMAPFEPASPVCGNFRGSVQWLHMPDGECFHRRPPDAGRLCAGILRVEPGSFASTTMEPEDSYVISGSAVLVRSDGITTNIAPGTAFAVDAGVDLTWQIEAPLVRFVVFGGVRAQDPAGQSITHATFSERFWRYGGDTIVAGSIERTILWLREGPEGTGGFFSGLLTIAPGQYRKTYVVDEYVLVLGGSRTLEIDGQVHTLDAWEVGAFARGTTALRTITSPVHQFFAGR